MATSERYQLTHQSEPDLLHILVAIQSLQSDLITGQGDGGLG